MNKLVVGCMTMVAAGAVLQACSVITGVSGSCNENPAEGTRFCTTIDTSQNITTRTIERDHKLYVSTCSNGNCTDYREVGGSSTAKPTAPTN